MLLNKYHESESRQNILVNTLKIIYVILPSQLFDMHGGDAALEKLQEHEDDKIANFATKIIETHYSD